MCVCACLESCVHNVQGRQLHDCNFIVHASIVYRAKALFVENAEQVKEMVKVLGCEMHEDYLYHV